MPSIVIADDHVVIRQGISALISTWEGFSVVGEASDGMEVIKIVEKIQPDILLIDLSMPNLGGLEAITRITRSNKQVAIIVLSSHETANFVREALRAGAKGYVPKSSDMQELLLAMKAVLNGNKYLSPSIIDLALNNNSDISNEEQLVNALSTREREIMRLLAEGKRNRDIAKMLHISHRTVDTHRTNILKKLDLSSNVELTRLATKAGMLE
jgi:DNA-binding NarL/FixJ family response regulator